MNKVLNVALYAWASNLFDPSRDDMSEDAERCRKAILHMIQDGGLGWQGWVKHYPGDGAFKWCGAFAAYCMPHVKPELRKKWWASTYRLSEYGSKHPGRKIKTLDTLPGDVVCVGDGGYGSHIALAVAWDKSKTYLTTVSGNGVGRLPNGNWGEGVVLNQYHWQDDVRAVYRPIKDDLWNG